MSSDLQGRLWNHDRDRPGRNLRTSRAADRVQKLCARPRTSLWRVPQPSVPHCCTADDNRRGREVQSLGQRSGSEHDDSDATLTYQWQRDTNNIGGATGSTYTVVEADETHSLRVAVFSHDTDGSGTHTTVAIRLRLKASP